MTSAVIIGAGPGLGLALIRRFAREGLQTAFVARRAAAVAKYSASLQAEGLATLGIVGDAADPASLVAALAQARAAHGAPEVLIYNAAIVEPSRFVTPSGITEARYADAPGWAARGAPIDSASFEAGLRANVTGALLAAQSVAPEMIARGHGTILLTGGVLAFGPWIEWGAVSLGKAALRSLGHSLALELAPLGVQVATIAIHGTMATGTPYGPDLVAAAYWETHLRARQEWTPDVHFRPGADDGGDPDR